MGYPGHKMIESKVMFEDHVVEGRKTTICIDLIRRRKERLQHEMLQTGTYSLRTEKFWKRKKPNDNILQN